jgi:hypothetical protein
MPDFSAEFSLYRTNGHYRASTSTGLFQGGTRQDVVLALDSHSERLCSNCLEKCAENLGICVALAVATGALLGPAAAGAALAECDTQSVTCAAFCHLPGQSCCPNFCHLGKCCGYGETCVADSDPNARQGCCPAGQNVCGGSCCAAGATCCGGNCCPSGYFCQDGTCTYVGVFPTTPPPTPPSPTPPPGFTPPTPGFAPQSICLNPTYRPCRVAPDRWVCCPPNKECCGPRGCQGTCVA